MVARVRIWAEHVGFVVDKVALGRFSPSTSVSLANHHSTDFSIIIITRGWHNRPIGGRSAEWTQLDFTPHYTNKKKISVEIQNFIIIGRSISLIILQGFIFSTFLSAIAAV
jgi:hypothetical protein